MWYYYRETGFLIGVVSQCPYGPRLRVPSGEVSPYPHSVQTQKSNATFGFRRLKLCKNLKREPARLL